MDSRVDRGAKAVGGRLGFGLFRSGWFVPIGWAGGVECAS
ncbi:MAG: hypothetical protein ACI9WU_002552 [Myxococcota bacterium]|jgi:hypothetical protein